MTRNSLVIANYNYNTSNETVLFLIEYQKIGC